MLRISQLKLPAGHTQEQLVKKLLHTLHIKENELKKYTVKKRSLDARKKPELYYVYSIDVSAAHENRILRQSKGNVQRVTEQVYHAPDHGREKTEFRPVVIGSGPAGLFCAYLL